ncbi:MAG: aconitate hydratase AcnA [Rickettsiaceae bacterium]|nr:aconitate hydratase AcnA [Rickettsiaceae bacterium]MDP4832840.1 aconitate hydratase AcnA [Rickettsiaceae bacterium]MDP5020578.1 aconitate hydratase AcnA [Rickettsiaceae bacterium]MDP5083226.1 aconitate hydratase AcnA [Rickettsiaceae bacterium]
MSTESELKYAKHIELDGEEYTIFDIKKAASDCDFDLEKLPYSLRVLFENVVRNSNADEKDLEPFKKWLKNKTSEDEINYMPARVLMQDFTGVPAIVDLASMRDAMKMLGDSPHKINPMIPVDLVIDHSVQVDSYGSRAAFEENVQKEVERNKERYQFLKWGQKSFRNFRVVPPGTGICHQVNLECLAQTVYVNEDKERKTIYPDTLVGTDSHTTMVNALAVLGWGVGGIEAEAAMLGQPLPMILPEVIGFKMTGVLGDTITATDLVLTVTQLLRQKGVVGKFVEFFGPGVESLSLADRATISNMAPEYGATCGFFPIDYETLKYLRFTGREEHKVKVVEEYAKMQNMWRNSNTPEYTDVLELDMTTIEPSLAGPKRPQDRVALSDMQNGFKESLPSLASADANIAEKHFVGKKGDKAAFSIGHGDIVIAAITSCTNTSNPSVMIAAGIVAEKAVKLGLKTKPWVKTSLAPGSKVVTEYLNFSGLDRYLDSLGFNLVGYGCTTCIGNSGPLEPEIDQLIRDKQLVVSSVLSGNRNFEGRVHPHVRANYLASPPLVVAYALAGTVNIDLDKDPIATTDAGKKIYLKDIWPTRAEIHEYMDACITPKMFAEKYNDVFAGDTNWRNILAEESDTYNWQESSTYIKNPPYFDDINKPKKALVDIKNARLLALFGDSITTDHISPAGMISKTSPAAQFLMSHGVSPAGFNSYGSRRGNHEVMMRGTFANVRIKNQLCNGVEGGVTINHFTKEQMSIYDAAMDYKKRSVPLVIFAGKEYGTGSSRDWAAKGTNLLGVKAVIAESFERIHRSNLVGMGVLPIAFQSGMNWQKLNLNGDEEINIEGVHDDIKPYQPLKCVIKGSGGNNETIEVTLQVYTDNEIEYIKHGSILGAVIKNLSDK